MVVYVTYCITNAPWISVYTIYVQVSLVIFSSFLRCHADTEDMTQPYVVSHKLLRWPNNEFPIKERQRVAIGSMTHQLVKKW